MQVMRKYTHPDINHTFIIEDHSNGNILVDGILVTKKEFYDVTTHYNQGPNEEFGKDVATTTLLLTILNKKNDECTT